MLRPLLACLALQAACYSPSAVEGAPCVTSDQCPSSQKCINGACGGTAGDASVLPKDAPADAAADAPADAAALKCNLTGVSCNGSLTIHSCASRCWYYCSKPIVHTAAAAACTAWQGSLAEIDSQAEQDCLPQLADKTWVGLAQPVNQPDVGKGWSWNSARALVFTNWQIGAPNDNDGIEDNAEQCGHIQVNGTWDDEDCAQPRGMLCERPIL